MVELQKSEQFDTWLRQLRDPLGRGRILARLERLATGHCGDARMLGGGLYELRIACGPGYRVYYARRGGALLLLLCGGDKSTQQQDIWRARLLAGHLVDLKEGATRQ